jgi:acetylglutamate kinase
MKDKIRVFKIGGKVIDNEALLERFLVDLSKIPGKKALIHGGGKIATSISEKLGIQAQMVNGRRITDKETLDVVLMVYGGLINKKIVAQLQSLGVNAIGLSGADLNMVQAHKRPVKTVDYGFVGDVDGINHEGLALLLEQNILPVLAPLSHDGKGQMLNTNADTIAAVTAMGLSKNFEVELFFCFEKNGVLADQNDDGSVIKKISSHDFADLKEKGIVSEGMLPKLENSFDCIQKGVSKVIICHFSAINELESDIMPGTVLFNTNQ